MRLRWDCEARARWLSTTTSSDCDRHMFLRSALLPSPSSPLALSFPLTPLTPLVDNFFISALSRRTLLFHSRLRKREREREKVTKRNITLRAPLFNYKLNTLSCLHIWEKQFMRVTYREESTSPWNIWNYVCQTISLPECLSLFLFLLKIVIILRVIYQKLVTHTKARNDLSDWVNVWYFWVNVHI